MKGPLRKAFLQEKYDVLFTQLTSYSLDPYIRNLNASQAVNPGKIFPFVRGLRFSALLIYTIRRYLKPHLLANWGQIIDDDGTYLSNECDIIIHQKGDDDDDRRWNGNIMDFRFVDQADAKVVISCKSYIESSNVETDYFNNLIKFVPEIWLFSECCGPRSVAPIDKKAKATGYGHFFHIYTYSKTTGVARRNFPEWERFVEAIKKIR